jgi:hypothetical protein
MSERLAETNIWMTGLSSSTGIGEEDAQTAAHVPNSLAR